MVMFWRSWATGLTEEEKDEIERISYGHAWLNWNKKAQAYFGYFYHFPKNSGFELGDSPTIPDYFQEKVSLDTLETGWLEDKTFTPLETVAMMLPEDMEKLWQRFKSEIKETEHLT